MTYEGYETLEEVLKDALKQAAIGKGRTRHANNRPFTQQPMQDLIRQHGLGFATGQAAKKAQEVHGLPTAETKIHELLGAINYLAGAVVSLRQAEGYYDEPKM